MNELYATSAGHGRRRRRGLVGAARPDRFTGRGAPAHPHSSPTPSASAPASTRPGDDLERITRTLTSLREQVISDPLAFWVPAQGSSAPGGGRPDTTVYDREARALEDVRREIDAVLDRPAGRGDSGW